MKAKLLPLYFKERNPRETREFEEQLKKLQILYGAEADFLPPQPLGEPVPPDADAIVFPQLLGAVFQYREFIESVSLPIIILPQNSALWKCGTGRSWLICGANWVETYSPPINVSLLKWFFELSPLKGNCAPA